MSCHIHFASLFLGWCWGSVLCVLIETDRLQAPENLGVGRLLSFCDDFAPGFMLFAGRCIAAPPTALLVLILSFCYETRSPSSHFEILKVSPTSPVGWFPLVTITQGRVAPMRPPVLMCKSLPICFVQLGISRIWDLSVSKLASLEFSSRGFVPILKDAS